MNNKPEWHAVSNSIDDDAAASWQCLMLRAEDMGGWWWWAVYDGDEVASSNDQAERCHTTRQARWCAEGAARDYLEANNE